jgi:hypothetical protein
LLVPRESLEGVRSVFRPTGELYLRRLDKLEEHDDREGLFPEDAVGLRFTPEGRENTSLFAALEGNRKRTFASCLTLRLDERQSMWTHTGTNEAVAIAVVYDHLIEALGASSLVLLIGGVCYLDTVAEYVNRFGRLNTYNLAFCKGTAFREEQEVRVVYQDHGTDDLEDHCRAAIDLDRLRLFEVVLAWSRRRTSRQGAEPRL